MATPPCSVHKVRPLHIDQDSCRALSFTMSIFKAGKVNIYVSVDNDVSDERLVVDRGTLSLYASGALHVVDKDSRLACNLKMGHLSHMNQKMVQSSNGNTAKGRT